MKAFSLSMLFLKNLQTKKPPSPVADYCNILSFERKSEQHN